MRFALVLVVLFLGAGRCRAEPEVANPPSTAAGARDEARWADWEAQARVEDGDYDGAVQAERQAETDRRAAAGRDARVPAR